MKTHVHALMLSAVLALAPAGGHAGYSGLYVFGDSLSDSGNNAIVIDLLGQGLFNIPAGTLRTPLPIPNFTTNGSLVPTLPYRSSALTPGVAPDRYTNGRVWAEDFAQAIGLPGGGVAALAGGTNYSFAGARVGPVNFTLAGFPFSLQTQVVGYLAGTQQQADPNALYVVAGGGNDGRDALGGTIASLIEANGNQITAALYSNEIAPVITNAAVTYAIRIGQIVGALKGANAGDIVVWNVPDLGLTPETTLRAASFTSASGAPTYEAIGSLVAGAMSAVMASVVSGVPGVRVLDVFNLLRDGVTTQVLPNVTDACAAVVGCNPSQYLFWDGIHPTSAGHALLANAMMAAVPEPETYAMMAVGVALIGWQLRRRARKATRMRLA